MKQATIFEGRLLALPLFIACCFFSLLFASLGLATNLKPYSGTTGTGQVAVGGEA